MRDVSLPPGPRTPRRPRPGPPPAVTLANVALGFGILLAFLCPAGPFEPRIAIVALWGLSIAWSVMALLILEGALNRREPFAWAGAVAVLGTRGAGFLASAAVTLECPPQVAVFGLIPLATAGYFYLLFARELFAVREWFGIGPREGWLVLLGRGRMFLLVTLILELALAWTRHLVALTIPR